MSIQQNQIRNKILIELGIKSYNQEFQKNFYFFLKRVFFRNFGKKHMQPITIKRLTLLRSIFVNKSSQEQFEKKIINLKVYFLFYEHEFKIFKQILQSLNFKGVSIYFKKVYFNEQVLEKKAQSNPKNKTLSKNKLKKILSFSNIKQIKKTLLKNYYKKVILTNSSKKNSLTKLSLHFLKRKSLKKNRIRVGLFKSHFSKKCFIFSKSDLTIKSKNSSLKYAYSMSKRFKILIKRRNYLAPTNSKISRLWINHRVKNKIKGLFLGGTELKANSLNNFFTFLKLLVSFKKIRLFKNAPKLINSKLLAISLNENKRFYRFLSLINSSALLNLKYQINKKALKSMISTKKHTIKKLIANYYLLSGWLLNRINLRLSGRSWFKIKLSSEMKSVISSRYFKRNPVFFFFLYYKLKKKQSFGKVKYHLRKRLKFLLKHHWGSKVRRIRFKKRFFKKIRNKFNRLKLKNMFYKNFVLNKKRLKKNKKRYFFRKNKINKNIKR